MKPSRSQIRMLHPIDDPLIRQRAAIRLARTRKSLDWLLRRDDDGVALFADVHPEQMIVALDIASGEPVGMIGWTLNGRDMFRTEGLAFRKLYGPLRGTARHWIYRAQCRLVAVGDGAYISALWVDPAWRPRGVGTMIIKAASRVIEPRIVADIRCDDARGRLLFGREGMQPMERGLIVALLRRFGFERLSRPAGWYRDRRRA